ncbi:MAG: hypothetical protein ACE5I7_00900 [Candidatus Binatia bacterium]
MTGRAKGSARISTATFGCSAAIVGILLLWSTPSQGFDLGLWPLINYHSDASGTRRLRLLGPLFSYESGPERTEWALRPLFSYVRGPRVSQNQFSVLYPIFVSRWEPRQTQYRLFGLISYRRESSRAPHKWERRFTIFPFIFYRYSRTRGTSLAVLPFYADLRDFFGYKRIRLLGFYLHLQRALIEHTWLPFPFVSWTGGKLGRGVRVWPFYGWEEKGAAERFRYVLWPFYISYERHFRRLEHERRLILFPFYARIDAPGKRSRSYFGPFLTHTIDRKKRTETWGFPWPLWVSRRDLATGKRTGLRLAPFYGDTHFGDLHSQFVMWPAYRWETQETETYRHRRRDALLLLYRDVEQVQPAYGHRRHLRTLFPLYRALDEDGDSQFGMLGLLDALFPLNPTIKLQYAPLWQLYTREQQGASPARWSLLWDLISSDGTRLRYPVHLDLSE